MTAGIVLVSIWMTLSLGYSWVIRGFGSNYVGQLPRVSPAEQSACFDRYTMWWGFLMLLHLVVIVAAIVLWALPRTKAWGLVVGFVATGIPAFVFTIVWRVPL
jgi:hypothetical protein